MRRHLLFLFFLLGLGPSLATACEGCKMAVVKGMSEPQTVMAGMALSWSVLFMLAVVFLLLAVLVWFIRSACLQADTAHRTNQ